MNKNYYYIVRVVVPVGKGLEFYQIIQHREESQVECFTCQGLEKLISFIVNNSGVTVLMINSPDEVRGKENTDYREDNKLLLLVGIGIEIKSDQYCRREVA